jgi:hypothetical protein
MKNLVAPPESTALIPEAIELRYYIHRYPQQIPNAGWVSLATSVSLLLSVHSFGITISINLHLFKDHLECAKQV